MPEAPDRLWSLPCTEAESDPFLFARGADQMRIGIVTEYYYPTLGGIQEHVHHFARRGASCRSRRSNPDTGGEGQPGVRDGALSRRPPGAPTTKTASSGSASPSRCSRADRSRGRRPAPALATRMREVILRAEKFDVVHVHSPLMPTLPLLALRAPTPLNVGTFHSAFDRSLLLALLQAAPAALRRSACTRRSVSRRRRSTGVRRYFRAPWHVIPNGVDVAAFAAGRRRPEFDDGRLNVLHVGRFDPRNGVDRVIRGLGRREAPGHRRAADRSWATARCGRDTRRWSRRTFAPTPTSWGSCRARSAASYYASGDVLLCPAVGGTFGIIVLEAMAAGCAVVAADTPGFRNVVARRRRGALVDVSTRSALAPSSPTLREPTAGRRGARGAAAWRLDGERAARFDWPVVTDQRARPLRSAARRRERASASPGAVRR